MSDDNLENDHEAIKRDLRNKVNLQRTICEVHREIYDFLEKNCPDEQVIGLLEEAFIMAKKIDAKLRQRVGGYDEGWYKKERDEILDAKRSLRASRK